MSTIALPADFCPRDFSLRLQVNQVAFSSPFGGSEQVVDRGNDRWTASMTLPARRTGEGAAIEAFVAGLRGLTNTVGIYHFARPIPRGTMRGTPISNFAPIGSASITIPNAGIGATLLAGDLIGVSGLLLMVASDAVADGGGSMVVPIVNRLRTAITGGAAVTWDKPTTLFRLASSSSVQYVPGYAPEVSLEFVEAIG